MLRIIIYGLSTVLPLLGETENTLHCSFLVHPKTWTIQKNSCSGTILLAWGVNNTGNEYRRFRIRNLGKITITDLNGKAVQCVPNAVDATSNFSESQYPMIGPNETFYFSFGVTFTKQDNGLYSLKVRNMPGGDEGFSFSDLSPGKYLIMAEYEAKVGDPRENDAPWKIESVFMQDHWIKEFWVGKVQSNTSTIEISDD